MITDISMSDRFGRFYKLGANIGWPRIHYRGQVNGFVVGGASTLVRPAESAATCGAQLRPVALVKPSTLKW